MLNSFYQDDDEDEQRAMAALAANGGRAPQTIELPQMNIRGHLPAGPMAASDFDAPDDEMAPEPGGADPVSALAAAAKPRQSAPAAAPMAASAAPSSTSSDDDESPIGWGDALGLIADIALNKSRGVGQILGGIGKGRKNKLDEEYKRAQIAHLQSSGAHSQEDKDWQHWKDVDASQRGYRDQDLREKEFGRRETSTEHTIQKYADQVDPNSQANVTKVDMAGRVVGARNEQNHADVDMKAGDAAQIGGARSAASTDARQDTQHDNAPRTREDAAEQAAAVTAAQLPNQQVLKASPTAADQPGSLQNRQFALTGEKDDRAAAKDFATATKPSREILETIGSIDALEKKYGGLDKVPGAGFGDAMVPDAIRGLIAGHSDHPDEQQDAIAMSGAKKALVSYVTHAESGAAARPDEQTLAQMRLGASLTSTPAQLKAGLDAARRHANMEVGARSVGNKMAGQVMRGAGLEQAPAQGERPPTPQLEGMGSEGANLGTSPLPPKPNFGTGSKRMRTVTSPSGNTGERPLSDEEAEMLSRKPGWSVQ